MTIHYTSITMDTAHFSCSFDLLIVLEIEWISIIGCKEKMDSTQLGHLSLCSDQQHIILRDTADCNPLPLFIPEDRIGSSFKT